MPDEKRNMPTYWIGGAPCCGKSTISHILQQRNALDIYHVDDSIDRLSKTITSASHPFLSNWFAASWEERWMKSHQELMEEVTGCYREHFQLVLQDLKQTAYPQPVLVEGCALLPDEVAALGIEPNRAVWVVPSEGFQKHYYAQRPFIKPILASCSQPETAFANWMDRDAAFAKWTTAEAEALGFRVLTVDGSVSAETTAQTIAEIFNLQPREKQEQ